MTKFSSPTKLAKTLREDGMDAVLDANDATLLEAGLGLKSKDVKMLRGIWTKLRDRRLGRHHVR